jgi:uncharacterized 2Fe-2S/4Fe-4S cluster protein (DUF4445 family)
MPKVTFLPSGQHIEIDEETTIREAAHLLNVSVHDRCGGMGACCNCIVTVLEGMNNICPKSVVEEAVFYLSENDRLSCLTGDVVVKTI